MPFQDPVGAKLTMQNGKVGPDDRGAGGRDLRSAPKSGRVRYKIPLARARDRQETRYKQYSVTNHQ